MDGELELVWELSNPIAMSMEQPVRKCEMLSHLNHKVKKNLTNLTLRTDMMEPTYLEHYMEQGCKWHQQMFLSSDWGG